MKKIYIFAAVLALLTLSLNAQLQARKNVAHKAASTGKVMAPNRDATVLDFTAQGYTNAQTVTSLTVGDVTVTFDEGSGSNSPKYYTDGNAVRVYGGNRITVSSATNNIIGITFTYGSSDGTKQISANVGTWSDPNWTGDAQTVQFSLSSGSGQRRIAKIEVTLKEGGQGGDDPTPSGNQLTVPANATATTFENLPVWGYWYDATNGQHNQMIYPASMLEGMEGTDITSLTFYTYGNLRFYGGSVTLSLGTTASTTFSSASPLNDNVTAVATVVPEASTGNTEWKITLTEPYHYEGGNLLVDVVTVKGNWGSGRTYFYAQDMNSNVGFYSYNNSNNANTTYLPKVTFNYVESTPVSDLAISLSAPASVVAGNPATVTATVTNSGNQPMTGYTVTISDGSTVLLNQTVNETLAAGATKSFTVEYPTTEGQVGATVNFSANVTSTDDSDATNNNASASMQIITLPAPENVAATSGTQSGTMTWNAPSNLPTTAQPITESFENGTNGWTFIDADGDGYNWTWHQNTGTNNLTTNTGDCNVNSESYDNDTQTALTPNNWLISPEAILDGTFSLYASGQDNQGYDKEVFGVYVCVGSYTGIDDFEQVDNDVTTSYGMAQYNFDLSQYQGRVGHIAIVHHNVTDQFILDIDDISFIANVTMEPVSYNVYLDGQFVANVDANTFTYTFNDVSDGEHDCSVSAVYEGGIESAQVHTTFNIMPKTPTPTITYQVVGNNMVITATGQGTVNLSVTGGYSDSGEGTASVTIPLGLEEQTVTATATAQLPNYQESDPATQPITLPEAGRSPQPTITFTDNGDGSYTITVTGTGEVAVYIEDAEHAGAPIATADGTFSFNVEQHSQAMSITVTATNQEEGLAVSRPVTETYPIPAMTIDGTFQTLDPQPANASTPIDMSKLMFCDRFTVDIPNENNHPRLYDYYLQETQVRQRTSNSVEVPVKHTGSDGLGFYSLNQIDNDTVRTLKMDVRNAAMDLPLEADPNVYYYTESRGTVPYPDQAGRKYLAVLQRTSDGYYNENLTSAYDYGADPYPGGKHHIHLDTDTILGDYNQYLTYVPIVWTMGFDRVLYETDHVHNSYGAPKWKTGVGDVTLNTVDVELQDSPSATWNDGKDINMYIMTLDATGYMPTVNTMPYEPYMFRVFVESKNGKLRNWKWVPEDTVNLPHTGSHFEAAPGTTTGPICVWSEYVKDSVNVTFNGNEIYFVKEKVDRDSLNMPWTIPGEMNILFAAEANMETTGEGENERIIDDDLKIYVRFYYIVKGSADGHTPVVHGQRPRDGEGDAPAGYGSESPGTPPSPSTGVKEVQYYGDVVSTTYYNVQGMTSDKPFDGINIVVVRYSNGTTRTFKVVR